MVCNYKKHLSIILCVLLAVIFLCPTQVLYAQSYDIEESVPEIAAIMHYVKVDKNNIFWFDQEAAKNNNETEYIIKVGVELERFSIAMYQEEHGVKARGIVKFPVYGNYCGPGYSGEKFKQKPIDWLDSVCRTHDECYRDTKGSKTKCDQKLVDAVLPEYKNLKGDAKVAATLILAYFNRIPGNE